MDPAVDRLAPRVCSRLFHRALTTGALLGACLGLGLTGFSAVQAALDPDQFGSWGWNAGQIFLMTMVGLVVGAVAGTAAWSGSVAALWIEASRCPSASRPRALTAGLGAGVMTAVYAVAGLHVLGANGWALVGMAAGPAAAAGLLAAFRARRVR